MMNSRSGKNRRNRRKILINIPVGEHNIVAAIIHSLFSLDAHLLNTFFEPFGAIFHCKRHRHFAGVEALVAQVAEDIEFAIGDNRTLKFHHFAQFLLRAEQIHIQRADIAIEAHHKLLTQRVDRRICYLGKMLAEEVKQWLWFVAENSERSVVTHRIDRLFGFGNHWHNYTLDIFAVEKENIE